VADAAYWYEGQQQGLGRQFVDEVLAVFSVIAETPRLPPVLHRNTRRALLRRFPFGAYYQVGACCNSCYRSDAWQQKPESLERA